MSLGLGTISQKEAVVALQVYTELCEGNSNAKNTINIMLKIEFSELQ